MGGLRLAWDPTVGPAPCVRPGPPGQPDAGAPCPVYSFLGVATVTMSCASKCMPWDVDSFGLTWPVFCCDTDLCNVDGAPTRGSLHGLALTLALASLLSLQL